jgi:molybdopterin-containing oxidoreductase family iron-sulfur binding subunit
LPILAKVRDGRPIKIEGNDLCSFTGGGTSARAQASVLDLYDMYRIKFPQQKRTVGSDGKEVKFEEIPSFEQADKIVADGLAALNGQPVVLLTTTIVSPSTRQIISEFLAKYPGSRHVQYDEVSYSGMIQANEASGFGRKLPNYKFDAAKVIVSLGADFLATWLSPVEYARGYAKGRKIDEKNPVMSKHYQFESYLSTTGACADERFTHRPSETAAVAAALLSALGGSATAPAIADAKLRNGIEKVAADLKANNGSALVVCGSNDVNVQTLVNAINNAIGANGSTIDWGTSVNYRQGIDKDIVDLVEQMDAGQVGALLVYEANPAYSFFNAAKFKSGLSKVKLSVSFGKKMTETAQLCQLIIPDHHYLESWGDAEPKSGYVSFIQPTIYPLFKTRPFQTSLLRWSGNNTDYETYFRNYWIGKVGGDEAFNKVLQDGIWESAPATISGGSFNGSGVTNASTALTANAGGNELIVYQKVSIGTGTQAGNPWLQELPDPVSKATWDNYAMISVAKANELGIKLNNDYEYFPQKPVVKITIGKTEVELPVLVIPGMNKDTIAVAVGYGRSESMGVTAGNVGVNAYPFVSYNGTTVINYVTGVKIENTGTKYKIAQTQKHNTYEGRFEVVRETTLATFKQHPDLIKEYRDELVKDFASKTGDYRSEATLYPQYLQPGPKWGMVIDMNSCVACNACVVACHAENNVPVVGRREVMRYHDMHWLRIDRYFVSNENNPDDLKSVVFQPMLCQHCDNAPCENVCPVAATMHSSEGLNQMAYNRCIGTRYCAQNCPYKVRRFNWADYTGADSFPDNQDQSLIGKLDGVVHQMNDDLTRMVLNPDVVVRSRGVMEKCTFCVQKLQAAKLKAKKEDRILNDGDAKTACQLACPTEAIVFGNAHDKESRVTKLRNENPKRSYYVIEQLHTLPNITYLAKVRNTDEIIEQQSHEVTSELNTHGEMNVKDTVVPGAPKTGEGH